MNLGSNILEQRKKKQVTQEELAAELGVTAAAVSKWENGYTLPDILMLCALADYFAVTTDELLGRAKEWKYAVIAAKTPELGEKIKKLALDYGISTKSVCSTYEEALTLVNRDSSISFMLISMAEPVSEEELNLGRSGVTRVNVSCNKDQEILDSFTIFFQNMDAIQSLVPKKQR